MLQKFRIDFKVLGEVTSIWKFIDLKEAFGVLGRFLRAIGVLGII